MSKCLIVAATSLEIQPLLKEFSLSTDQAESSELTVIEKDRLSILITGVGMVNTAYCLGKYSHLRYDLVINAGVCGAFDRSIPIGEVVRVVTDTFSEMGAEDGDNFIPYNEMKLGGTQVYKERNGSENHLLKALKKVNGITVNTVHGNELSIAKTVSFFHPQTESMEGAAFFRSCGDCTESYVQIRAVSNYVERRDKNKWDMPLAINNLNQFILQFIHNESK